MNEKCDKCKYAESCADSKPPCYRTGDMTVYKEENWRWIPYYPPIPLIQPMQITFQPYIQPYYVANYS